MVNARRKRARCAPENRIASAAMSQPYTVLSPRIDPAAVLRAVRSLPIPSQFVTVHGERVGGFDTIVLQHPSGATLTIRTSSSEDPAFVRNRENGVRFFAAIETEALDARVVAVRRLATCEMMVGCVAEPRANAKFDDVVRTIAEAVDGTLMFPHGMHEPTGPLILGVDGTSQTSTPEGRESAAAQPQPLRLDPAAHGAPPAAARVAARAHVLLSMAQRGHLELQRGTDTATACESIMSSLRSTGSDAELEPPERAALSARAGTLDARTVNAATWQAEGAAVLAWAIHACELPAFDTEIHVDTLARALGDKAGPGMTPPVQLRSTEALEATWKHYLTVHWRLRARMRRSDRVDLGAVARDTPFGQRNMDLRGLSLSDGDLVIRGTPIARASEDDLRSCLGIAEERHRALNWLRGQAPRYADVETPT